MTLGAGRDYTGQSIASAMIAKIKETPPMENKSWSDTDRSLRKVFRVCRMGEWDRSKRGPITICEWLKSTEKFSAVDRRETSAC